MEWKVYDAKKNFQLEVSFKTKTFSLLKLLKKCFLKIPQTVYFITCGFHVPLYHDKSSVTQKFPTEEISS